MFLLAALLALAPRVAAAERCDGCLTAGAASVALRIPRGAPLAGYGSFARRLPVPDLFGRHPHAFWFKPSEGELDPLGARALVVEGAGARLAWVSADLIAVDRAFTARVAQRLRESGVPSATVILSASHTHSGPGAFFDSALLGALSVDRRDEAVHEALVESVVEAIRRADAHRVAARVGSASGAASGLTTGRLGRPVDSEIVVVKILAATGAPIAALWNFAIHGTMLGPRNLRLSGDVMGVATRELERRLGVPTLFVNGAVGDVSPQRHGSTEAQAAGRELAAAVRAVWTHAHAGRHGAVAIRTARVALPAPHLSLRNCGGAWIPRWLTVPLGQALPRETELVGGALGDAAWVAIPGELQSSLGQAIKRSVPSTWGQAFVAGVSNDYLGYFLTAADYARVTYVACASLYGPEAGETLTRAASELLGGLVGEGR
ncbi:MAG TPA: neutral/alkaline non-lysosomal ceramidase N-terminal domain-containing protein [Methylomirabilota bacterium]|nr:neutral/alkaline non-lysosomal ceramidase N-terminal domain-containing protein [Methylomirabilota bacterium]